MLFKRVSLEASLCAPVPKRSMIILWKGRRRSLKLHAFLCITGSLLKYFSIPTAFLSHAICMPASKRISTVSQYCHGNQSQSKLIEMTKPVAFKMMDTCPFFQSLLKLFVRPRTSPGMDIFSRVLDEASEKLELIMSEIL